MAASDEPATPPPPMPGIDVPAVTAWLRAHVGGLEAPFEFDLVAGGRSNLTYAITDRLGRRAILRRPPLGSVLATAHDMRREHRIISALSGTAVPVPRPLGLCEDPDVNGPPFYVMDFVEGHVVRDEEDAARTFPEAARPAVAASVVDVLADLHAVEPDDVGLGELGRREGYVERQLRRWYRQFADAARRDVPALTEAHRRLAAAVPPQQRASLVHGDYRIDNLVLGTDGAVCAVLDWELCTLGDPLADVGMLLLNWTRPGEDTRHLLSGTPTAAGGFGTRDEILDRYARRSGLDVSRIGFYIALGSWKLACIAEGILARYSSGAMGAGGDVSPDDLADKPVLLAERALQELELTG